MHLIEGLLPSHCGHARVISFAESFVANFPLPGPVQAVDGEVLNFTLTSIWFVCPTSTHALVYVTSSIATLSSFLRKLL